MIFTYRDIPIYYEIHGSGRPLVTIHGWSPDHRLIKGCLEPVFSDLDSQWQRIYFDLPGMGLTPGAPWIDGSDAMLELVLAFIDGVLPGQRFAVAGESYGGYLTRGVIKQHPDQVDGMLLICPTVYQDPHPKQLPAFQILEKDDAFVNSLSEEDQQYFTGINVVQTPRVWQKFRDDVMTGLKLADYPFLEKSLSKHVTFSFDLDKLDAPFMKPSLMVMGRQDNHVGYRDQWDIIENFPRASFVVLDKAGHNMQIEQETVFHALVKDWLERVEAEG